MTKFILDNWQLISALIATCWAIFTYFYTQKQEIAWRRTEFIVDQSMYIDNDPEMRKCTLALYGKHPSMSIADFIKAVKQGDNVDKKVAKYTLQFEKYLNFIWRICYAYLVLKTLTKKDLLAFGVYILEIKNNSQLREYCIEAGYDEIITAAEKITGLV